MCTNNTTQDLSVSVMQIITLCHYVRSIRNWYVCMYVRMQSYVCVCICVDACKCVHVCRYIASRSASGRRQPQQLAAAPLASDS